MTDATPKVELSVTIVYSCQLLITAVTTTSILDATAVLDSLRSKFDLLT